jgi:hypothetical protein
VTRKQAFKDAKRKAQIPCSQQPSRQWMVHAPANLKGAGVRDSNPRHQGRIYEFEIPTGGGGVERKYIVDHHRDSLHGGIGHIHTNRPPKPGATSVAPGGRYGTPAPQIPAIPYDSRNR